MEIIDANDSFSLVDLTQYVIPPLPKVIDTRGYLYILTDTVFDGYFKIGRTIDLNKRLQLYNADKPFRTTFVHAVSKPFHNAQEVESKVIKAMYKVTSPTTFSKEWFLIEHLEQAITFIKQAETAFQLMENQDD